MRIALYILWALVAVPLLVLVPGFLQGGDQSFGFAILGAMILIPWLIILTITIILTIFYRTKSKVPNATSVQYSGKINWKPYILSTMAVLVLAGVLFYIEHYL